MRSVINAEHRRQASDGPAQDPSSASLTVLQILDLRPLAGARLLTDPAVAAKRSVDRCSVQEGPIERFVRPHELVLTGAFGLGDDPDGFRRLIEDVARANASALAVAVGGNVRDVPTVAIQAGDRLELPIIELPWETRFSEITEAILEQVLDRQHALLRQSEQIHELLTDVVLSGGQLSQLRDSVSQLLSRPVSIVDRWGEPVDGSSAAPHGQADGPPRPTALPISAKGQQLGTMYVMAGDSALSDLDLRIARHGTTAAALIMLMQKAFAEGEARSRTEFVSAVLHGWIDQPGSVEDRAAALGIEPRRPYVVVYLQLETTGTTTAATLDAGRWALSRALAARRMAALEAWQGSEAALLVPAGVGSHVEPIRHLLDDASTLVRRHHPDAKLTSGIGSIVDGLAEAPRSFREAMTACRLGSIVNGRGSMTRYGDLGAYPALFEALTAGRSDAAFEELRDRYLAPIIRYEQRTRLPLTDTLTAFFDNNGNVSAAARDLGINRQSLLYRLAKVESLATVDLSSSMSRFALELALRARYVESGVAPSSAGSDEST